MAGRKKIALLMGQADEYYQAQFVEGFTSKAFENDIDVVIFGSYLKYQNSRVREIGETSIFSLVPYEEFDAVAVMADTLQSPGLSDSLEEIIHERCKCPVIFVDKESKYFPSIFPNHYEDAKKLVNHLIEEHGYTDIAYLTGKAWHQYSRQRLQGFIDAMSEHGLNVGKERVFYGDFWYTSGENLGDRLIKKGGKLPQAIACANDCMAIGLATALTDGGLRIPEDIAVIGYDSMEEGRYSPAPITSVKLPARAMGVHALENLLDWMNGREAKPFTELGEFFRGSSCGCTKQVNEIDTKYRQQWPTDTSHNSVFSSYNHLDEDLVIQNDFDSLTRTVFSYVFQIRDFESFSICLNDKWKEKAKAMSGTIEDSRLTPEKLSETDRYFSRKMMHVIACRPEHLNCDRVSDEVYFDRDLVIPRLGMEREKPEAFFITPMHFEDSVFGYAVLSYTEPKSYKKSYRFWLHSVMRGLENFRRYDELITINKKLEASIIRDPLTGIYNYNGFLRQTEETINMNPLKGGEQIGVFAIDIKNLSKINNDDGRKAGDNAIINVARSLGEVFSKGSVFCMGNGEMVAIEVMKDADVQGELEKRFKQLDEKIEEYNASLPEGSRHVKVYYGTADGQPKTRDDYERLVNLALSRKNGQKINFQRLSADGLDDNQIQEATIVNSILDENKINYHFQPIINARTGEIYAYEALMRADTNPYIQPLLVIKYAEIFGRLYDIEYATFNNVLNYVMKHNDEFKQGAKIFINSIPGQRLNKVDLKKIYDMTSGTSDRLVVEFTEQSEIDDDALNDMKQEYESLGFETAVDDYGTGYSNVSNLLRYMPKYVKIDRALLANIQDSPQKQHFVKDIIEFSHDNDILALAEGIETSEEIATVIGLGIDLIQGYYTARPSDIIIKEIDPDIKAEIIKYSRARDEEDARRIYVAGREARISIPRLIKDGFNIISITSGEVTHRDLVITGVPGDDAQIGVEIGSGYKGRILLENCTFSGRKHPAAIDIAEDCEVVISVSGENKLMDGGIRVASTSTLIFEGDGKLAINVTGKEAFGIGNDMGSYHGDLVFDQDGLIDITINASKGIAIGSGLGGHTSIRRGAYKLNLMGQQCVGFGSIEGNIEPLISNCAFEVKSTAINAVGIGSFTGNCDTMIEHSSVNMDFFGSDVVLVGSKKSDKLNISIFSAAFTMKARAHDITAIGSGTAAPTNINIDYLATKIDIEGSQTDIFRGVDSGVKVRVSNSRTEGSIVTNLEDREYDGVMDYKIWDSTVSINRNGQMISDHIWTES